MELNESSLQALRKLIVETDLILSAAIPLPENRTACCQENLKAAIALTNDLIDNASIKTNPAAVLGKLGVVRSH